MRSQRVTEKEVLYEDNHLIAIRKEAGTLVQGDKSGDQSLTDSLSHFLKMKYKKPGNAFVGLIHRIDRPVSGLVLFAKTSKGLSRMNEIFRNREVKKVYLALVEGKVTESDAHLTSYLKKDASKNKSFAASGPKDGYKKAALSFTTKEIMNRYSLLEVHPMTGRHHQIRAQLAEYGHIIKGDLKYGAKRSNGDASICLHAHRLEFIHPIKKENVVITCPLVGGKEWANVVVDD